MPLTIISWLNETRPPRIRFGDSSARYIGETNEAVPTDRPRMNRAAISSFADCANAHSSAAPV